MDQQSNASHASFGNLKIDPHKLDMLDARISGEGGVESSFEELSKLSSYTPPRSAMSEFNDDSKSNKPLVSFENDNEASQASCQTVHAGNLKSKTKDNNDDKTSQYFGQPKIDNSGITPPSSKKKRTPSKRPASAIGGRQLAKKQVGSTESETQSKKLKTKTKPSEDTKKSDGGACVSATPSESTTATAGEQQQQQQSAEASKSESRDMHYYFGAHSNPSRSQPLQLSSPPALHSKKEQKSANQKTLHSFLGITTKKHVDKEKKGKEESCTDAGVAKAGAAKEKQLSDVSATSSSTLKQATQVNTLSSRPKKKKHSSSSKDDATSESNNLQIENKRMLIKIEELQKQLEDANARNNSIRNNQTMISTNLQRQLKSLKSELESVRCETSTKTTKAMDVIEKLVREESIREAKDLRQKLASDGARLGRLVSSRVGLRSHDHWEDGHDPLVVKHRKAELKMKREALERRREELAKAQANSGVESPERSTDTLLESESSNSHADLALMNDFDRFEASETIRMHLDEVRREEANLNEEERALLIEKQAHVRALKRVASEDSSKFRQKHKLDDRYVLMNLLGKGGFSEVWRAYDLIEMQHVAVKIHQLESSWSDAKKENYTKHVSREYEIHRDVRHPRIVSLYSVFEIDTDSFATVLECCKGTDLDTMLKDKGRLPERDARAILLQILSGMKYLSSPSADGRRQGIIHYDLKPGNILFDEQGNAKITDFGLSKIVDTADAGDSMELTSQGAGTYWYLPPECFLIDQDVRISNKVDVWSIGVIYFQMLFGRRPFGDGQSQDHILRNQTMLNATEVHFPSTPAISEGAKAFIRDSLAYDQHTRPNMSKLCEHSYLRSTL